MSKAQRPIRNLPDDIARQQGRAVVATGNRITKGLTARSAKIQTTIPTDVDFGITVGSPARPIMPQFVIRNNGGSYSLYVRVAPETRVAGVVTVLGVWRSVLLA